VPGNPVDLSFTVTCNTITGKIIIPNVQPNSIDDTSPRVVVVNNNKISSNDVVLIQLSNYDGASLTSVSGQLTPYAVKINNGSFVFAFNFPIATSMSSYSNVTYNFAIIKGSPA